MSSREIVEEIIILIKLRKSVSETEIKYSEQTSTRYIKAMARYRMCEAMLEEIKIMMEEVKDEKESKDINSVTGSSRDDVSDSNGASSSISL